MANMESEGQAAPKWANGLAVMNAGKPLAALEGNTEPILARLRSGERAQDIAASLGINHVSLYEWLLAHCPEQWLAISSAKSLVRHEKAETLMDDAVTALDVSKARESARIAQWHLERTAKRFYGDVKQQSGVVVNVIVDRSCGGELTIEGNSE